MVIIDANVLIALVSKKTHPDDLARLEGLLVDVSKTKSHIGIPTPALAEFLVRTDAATQGVFSALERKSAVRVLPFDKKAAYECAQLDRAAREKGNKRGSATGSAYQKVKVDRQIVAIAKAVGATAIISDDAGLRSVGKDAGLLVRPVCDLPIPESARQHALDLVVSTDPTPARISDEAGAAVAASALEPAPKHE